MRRYNKEKNDLYWTEEDIYWPLDNDYMSLVGLLACKDLDGHDEEDQWYMAVERKMAELLELLSERPGKAVSNSADTDK